MSISRAEGLTGCVLELILRLLSVTYQYRLPEDINRAQENIKENNKISTKENLILYELKQHKPRFEEKCSRFLDQKKQAKMQWLQNPYHSNVDNLNDVRPEASRHCRNKKMKYLEAKINELETNRTIKILEACIGASVTITLILRRSSTGTVWFYTSTSNKRAARPKLYTKSLTRDLKPMFSRLTLVRISIKL